MSKFEECIPIINLTVDQSLGYCEYRRYYWKYVDIPPFQVHY